MTRKYDDLMVDIETLGTGTNARVLSIGAVFFDRQTRELGPTFNAFISVASDPSAIIDPTTVLWWLQQDPAARDALNTGLRQADPAREVCRDLITFVFRHGSVAPRAWSLPPGFDLRLIRELFVRQELDVPWAHWNERCLRTKVGEQRGIPVDRPEPTLPHDALADAVAQAQWLMAVDAAETAASEKA